MSKLNGRILIIDDDADVVNAARLVLKQRFAIVEMETNPERINYLLHANRYDVILLDMNFSAGRTSGNEGLYWLSAIRKLHSDQQVVLITAYGDIKLAVEAMKAGAADFVVKPWDNEKLEATVLSCFNYARANKEIKQLKSKQSQLSKLSSATETEIIGQSRGLQDVLSQVNKVATTDANVLILGENGTGKELIAKLIHQKSKRAEFPFIKVDVGSLPSNLFESELFGHKKGAFTDAKEDRIGRIELANNGSLFIDEIGNLPSQLQSKLLSVLQNREIIPLGHSQPIPIDVRLITATNLDIQDAISKNIFREDLYYRINTVELTLPPLRERIEDIGLLANYFLKFYSQKYRKEEKRLSPDALQTLEKYHWPGNIRELQHALERAVILSDRLVVDRNDFVLANRRSSTVVKEAVKLEEMEKNAIINAIKKFDGNMSKVAKELGLGRTTLYRKMSKFGITSANDQKEF